MNTIQTQASKLLDEMETLHNATDDKQARDVLLRAGLMLAVLTDLVVAIMRDDAIDRETVERILGEQRERTLASLK